MQATHGALAATTKEWGMSDEELLDQLMPAIAMDDDDAEDLEEIGGRRK